MATQPNIVDLASAVVDRLGDIKAQIAELKKIEADLIERLIISGETAIDGSLFRATVSYVSESSSLDPKAAEAKLRELGVDGRWFSKNQKIRKASFTVRVSARKS